MRKDIEYYVHTYVKCQNTKLVHKKKFGLYRHKKPIVACPYEGVIMNFMKWLLEWQRKYAILAMVNKFSELAKFGPIKTTTIMILTANMFFDMWVRHHDILEVIISDHGGKFISKFWTFLIKKVKTS
jgi:hypothetical protein